MAQWLMNPTSSHEATSPAPIGPLAWEPPYAAGSGPRTGKKTKKKKICIYIVGDLINKNAEFLLWLSRLRTQLVFMRMQVGSLALLSGLRIQRCSSCGVGGRRGSVLTLLWLWGRLAAVPPIRPLAWELPCAMGAALIKQKNKVKFHQGHEKIS